MVHKSITLQSNFGEFVVVMNMISNTSTLETHEKITLNKDDGIGESQISVIWQCISITIPLAKVHLCKIYACLPLLFPSLSC